MSKYKEATGNFWKPEKEEEFIEGLLTKVEENVGANNSRVYHIETLEDHINTKLWGTTILDNRMDEVKVGQQVKITYKGRGKKVGGKQAPHIWKVEYKDVEAMSDGDIDDVLGDVKA